MGHVSLGGLLLPSTSTSICHLFPVLDQLLFLLVEILCGLFNLGVITISAKERGLEVGFFHHQLQFLHSHGNATNSLCNIGIVLLLQVCFLLLELGIFILESGFCLGVL